MGSIAKESSLTKFSVLDLEDETPQPTVYGKLVFETPEEIVHPKYGSGRIHGTFDLIIPQGVYRPTSKEGVQRAIQFLKSWTDEHGVTLSDLKYRDFLIRATVSHLGATVPGEMDQPLHMASAVVNMIAIFAEDIEAETKLFTRNRATKMESGNGFSRIMKNALVGNYEKFEDLPSLEFPILQPILSLTFLLGQLAPLDLDSERIENYKKGCKKIFQGFGTALEFDFLESCSDEMYKMVRGKDGGFLACAEWGAAAKGWVIDDNIREDLLFVCATEAFARVTALTNDVLGLRRDLNDEHPVNFVLRKIRLDGMTLEEAIAHVVGVINIEMKDMVLCGRKLMEKHEDDESLKEYLTNMFYATEGHIRGYGDETVQEKYGNVNMKIIYPE